MEGTTQLHEKQRLQELQAELYALEVEVERATYDQSLSLDAFAPLNQQACRKRAELKAALHRTMGLHEG